MSVKTLRGPLLAVMASLAISNGSAAAQDWAPSHEVEFVIPFGPGGGADLLARTLIAVINDEKLVPVPVVGVNKGGGGTAVGVGYVKASRTGDPHTLVLINPQTQLTPLRVPGAAGWRDLTPLVNVMLDDYLLVARGDASFGNATALAEEARQRPPGSLSVGSAGTADDLAITLIERAADIDLNPVRFNSGAEALTALLGGHVDLAAGNPLELLPHIRAGSIRALAVLRETRLAALPEVPTLKEQGLDAPAFQMWRGVALPAGVPAEAVEYWQNVFDHALRAPKLGQFVEGNLGTLQPISGEAYGAFLEKQETFYRSLLQAQGTN